MEIQHREEERKNGQHAKRRIVHRIAKSNKEKGANLDPYPAKKRMSPHDVPQKVKEEGKEITATPARLDQQVIEIIQKWKRDIHEEDTGNGNVQILGDMVGGCKKQLITVAEEGGRKMQRCDNQEEQGEAGRKWQDFARIVWDTIHGQITERECKN